MIGKSHRVRCDFLFLWDKFKLKRNKVVFVEIVNILITLDFKGVKVMEELKYKIENINNVNKINVFFIILNFSLFVLFS